MLGATESNQSMGGGKALVNAYYRSAEALGVQVRYESPVTEIERDGERFVAAYVGDERIEAKACVLAAGWGCANLLDSRSGYPPRGQAYGYQNNGYAGAGDVSFRCNVDYRGQVTNIRIGGNGRRY